MPPYLQQCICQHMLKRRDCSSHHCTHRCFFVGSAKRLQLLLYVGAEVTRDFFFLFLSGAMTLIFFAAGHVMSDGIRNSASMRWSWKTSYTALSSLSAMISSSRSVHGSNCCCCGRCFCCGCCCCACCCCSCCCVCLRVRMNGDDGVVAIFRNTAMHFREDGGGVVH